MTSYGDVRKIIEDVLAIIEFLNAVHKADNNLEEVMREIQVLSQLADDIKKNGRSFGTNSQLQSVFKEATDNISSLKKEVEKRQSKTYKVWERFKWAKKKNSFERDLEKVRRLSGLLSHLNTTLSLRELSDAQRDEMVRKFIENWKPAMAEALSKKAHKRVNVIEGTGEWILDNSQYQNWEQSGNGLLWIYGMQGCGKTGLAITIDDRLRANSPFPMPLFRQNTQPRPRQQKERQQEQSPSTLTVSSVFCYHQIDGMRELEDHMEILMSLWAQLVESKPECLPGLAWINASKANGEMGFLTGRRRVKFQSDLLRYALKHSGDTILILDGLDEIPRNLQYDTITVLKTLQKENDRCRILITSRPYESIITIFENDSKVSMEAPVIDLKLYIDERFSRSNWYRRMDFKPDEIIDILLPKCQNSFQLTKLLVDEVLKADNKGQCKRIISGLPTEVDDAYKRGLYRLKAEFSTEGLVDGLPCMAIQALFWVAFAKSPMTGDQLAHALAIADGDSDSDLKVKTWREHGIDSRTGKLVVVDPENGELIIAHKTLTTYLTKDETRSEFFPSIREHMHEVQLKCLLGNYNTSRVWAGSKEEFIGQFPLLTYALSNWGKGLESVLVAKTSLWEKTEEFLGTSFQDWSPFVKEQIKEVFAKKADYHTNVRHVFTHEFFSPGSIEGLYWVVFFDLQSLVPSWIVRQTDSLVKDPIPTTPLGLAAALNNTSMMRLLLQNGAQVNLYQHTSHFVKPPLHDAVWPNNEVTAQMLLQSGADMTLRRGVNDKSPLDLIYDLGREGVRNLFASHITGSNGMKAQELQFLVRTRRTQQLREAINCGIDINLQCENGKRALDYALEMENQEMINLLKDNGAVANLSWPAKKTDLCPYPVNVCEPSAAALVTFEKEYDPEAWSGFRSRLQDDLLVEIPVQTQCQIEGIVFETITADQGWSDYSDIHDTYIGAIRSRLDVALSGRDGQSESFVLQENLHASDVFRLHTNIWNLSELKVSSPAKARLMQDMKESTVLQIFARAWGEGWKNRVKYIRVRMYGEEIKPGQ